MKRWTTEKENAEGWAIVTFRHDDDHAEKFRIYTEGGKVIRGTDADGIRTTYPYKATGHGWENASGVRYETFRAGYQKGLYTMK